MDMAGYPDVDSIKIEEEEETFSGDVDSIKIEEEVEMPSGDNIRIKAEEEELAGSSEPIKEEEMMLVYEVDEPQIRRTRTRGGRRSSGAGGAAPSGLSSAPGASRSRSRSPIVVSSTDTGQVQSIILSLSSDEEFLSDGSDAGWDSEYGNSSDDDDEPLEIIREFPDDIAEVEEQVAELSSSHQGPLSDPLAPDQGPEPAPPGRSKLRGRPQAPKYNWTKVRPTTEPHTFTDSPGLREPIIGQNPIDFFQLVFTDRLKMLIVNETNKYAEVLKSKAQSAKARIMSWRRLDIQEFMIWLGLLYHMGTVKCSRIHEFWSTDDLFSFPVWRRCMARDRFLNILNSLHFTENPPYGQTADRLYKIKPMLEIFHDTMESVVIPTQRLCIDEPMVLWRGQLVFRMYMKGKRQKYGVKLYMLTEPSGLVLRIIVYGGASDLELGGPGHTDLVVHKLMEGKLDIGHSLFMDNYYNSVRLAHELLARRTYVTGTLRATRKGNPKPVISSRLRKGESTRLFSDEGVCVLKWKDRRDVLMVSSEFGPDMIDATNRHGRTFSKPEMVAEYNHSMGGVDRLDQLLAYYPIERKCLKWYKKLAIHIFHIILINSHILHNKTLPKNQMELYTFRLRVIRTLLSPILGPPQPSSRFPILRPPIPVNTPPLHSQSTTITTHKPSQRPVSDKGRRLQRRCVVCLQKKIRRDVTYYCAQCPNEPHFCVPDCFSNFHK